MNQLKDKKVPEWNPFKHSFLQGYKISFNLRKTDLEVPVFIIHLVCILSFQASFLFLINLNCVQADGPFKMVNPGYEYSFPKDHFAHPGFLTEWWYYTGHLKTDDSKQFGFELTFFRRAIESQRERKSDSAWVMKDIYFAHFAISDENEGRFYFFEKINRKGPDLAGAEADKFLVWNEDWRLEGNDSIHYLKAREGETAINLRLIPGKPPVIHGEDGISKKSQDSNIASHYYSLTRILTEGNICLAGKRFSVKGISWMDHEFFSHEAPEGLLGWEWFSIQLDNSTEIMLYLIRLKGGIIDTISSGTFIDPDGRSSHLSFSQFSVKPQNQWKSSKSGIIYPSGWRIIIPDKEISLIVNPTFKDQELITKEVTYFEGSCKVSGRIGERDITGVGYAEITGMEEPVFY